QRKLVTAWAAPPVGAAGVHLAGGLLRREDRELHPRFGEDLERLAVGGRLRQPQAFRLTFEARPEVREAPGHLRDLVASVGERQDHVVVDLRDGVAVAVSRGDAGTI